MAGQRIILAGGSGFIGRALASSLIRLNHDVVVLTRSPGNPDVPARQVRWDGRTLEDWGREVDGAAAVINLTGKSVNCRPSADNRRQIIQSRIDSVHAIAQAIAHAAHPPRAWVQASSLAIYGDPGETILTEQSPAGDDSTADICKQWESALDAAYTPATRKVALRIGFVLGRGGGALGTLERIARLFLGGRVGSGRQYISWLHMDDMVRIVIEAIARDGISGAYNACAPEPVTNARFMLELRRAVHRPWSPPAPSWAVRLGSIFMRTDPELALSGRRCLPRRLLDLGFDFRFTELGRALADLYPPPPAAG